MIYSRRLELVLLVLIEDCNGLQRIPFVLETLGAVSTKCLVTQSGPRKAKRLIYCLKFLTL